jgi:transcriptional regulator with XRE-family HTH domain
MNCAYNKRFLQKIRKALELTQQEMSNCLGITINCLRNYETGRSKGSLFFHQRMMDVYGIDMRQHPNLNRIVFCDARKVKPAVYVHLNTLVIE